ncbi:hypothetical protein [Bergeyella cardium]|uniref:Uncharacterized protein n=1 Tax=Bergeyella cardium TaxID=1585976 RepID=A0A6P1QSF0_9FLAO|nr:hypothetical protein [Bergeyella cardium]QHN64595.1 hypothetical protein DBX24_01145 [Bergeyella cardium]WHE33888.1 hypothetical protein P8603_01145 [Bergeyella cardium]WHF60538.1 hypothetical protein O0R51_01145 [Bergeyella cardium]
MNTQIPLSPLNSIVPLEFQEVSFLRKVVRLTKVNKYFSTVPLALERVKKNVPA